MKPRYLGLMIVLQCSHNSAYQLGELDGAISRLCYAAFRLIPYHVRSPSFIPVTQVMDSNRLASIEYNDTSLQGAGLRSDESTQEGQNLNLSGGVRMAHALPSEMSAASLFHLSLSVDPHLHRA